MRLLGTGCDSLHGCDVQLPDGNEIQIGPDRFKVPEILFQPVSRTAHSIALSCLTGCITFSLPV